MAFQPGSFYSKADIYAVLQVPIDLQRGAWDIGYRKFNEDFYLFVNIGIPGRTGHDYGNLWDGDDLVWYGNTRSNLNQPLIRDLLTPGRKVLIFTRIQDRAPFVFEGWGKAKSVENSSPVKILWSFDQNEIRRPETLPEEIVETYSFKEGAQKTVQVNKYERNVYARRECIRIKGLNCMVCGFKFEEFYGSVGKDYIQVHHIIPLSEIGENYYVDPVRDLVPICANCHAMVHSKNPPYSVEELKEILTSH